jgi:hypothetical protein
MHRVWLIIIDEFCGERMHAISGVAVDRQFAIQEIYNRNEGAAVTATRIWSHDTAGYEEWQVECGGNKYTLLDVDLIGSDYVSQSDST